MTRHFTRLSPVPGQEHVAARARLVDAYAEHQCLWRLFAAPEGTPRDFLYRRDDRGGDLRFYLVSARLPTSVPAGWQAQSMPYAPILHAGDRLRFDLRANPTISRKAEGEVRSRRHDVVMDAKRQLLQARGLSRWQDWSESEGRPALQILAHERCGAWLIQRGRQAGFAIDEDSLRVDALTQHAHEKGGRRLHYTSVDFSGELLVTDPAVFSSMLSSGLGHAKAFGCGLMLVRPMV